MQKFQFPHMGPFPAEIQVRKMTTEDQDVSVFFFLVVWATYQVEACITYKKKTDTYIRARKSFKGNPLSFIPSSLSVARSFFWLLVQLSSNAGKQIELTGRTNGKIALEFFLLFGGGPPQWRRAASSVRTLFICR